MRIQPVRKLHMGCGEPLSAVVATQVLRLDRRQSGAPSPDRKMPKRLLRRVSDR